MQALILKLIILVSIPIIIGVGIVLTIFYQQLWLALDEWERDSNIWINQTQQQILYNSVLSQQLLEQYSFNQLQLHMVVMKSLLSKYQQSIIIQNPTANFTVCSYRELIFNQCAQNVYDQLNENIFYADIVSFYARASFLATQTEGLIQLIYLYNSDTTSISYGVPSGFYNYTDSDYETCMGNGYIEPYDPRCRSWYTYAQQQKNNQNNNEIKKIQISDLNLYQMKRYFIYEPYIDAVIISLLSTLSSQIDYKNEFYSVYSIDFGMYFIILCQYFKRYCLGQIQNILIQINFAAIPWNQCNNAITKKKIFLVKQIRQYNLSKVHKHNFPYQELDERIQQLRAIFLRYNNDSKSNN
ncbi:transmembrane protein, putative (macronuclear) [Tetrahymena thermophila SB210]|uniref:Transmembrane protein, putative n=1 Tax=Tetrahymena thermophila (strain SB210) TaxID=312017 RepID=Q22XK4_TETTS|nr:transmembrane protein, putative [Tetrahymena thermophila SB210]EAR90006.2 transmembrane protein, putative [Tetrahymena thermophila SB210]|eukprot:XP_001010251.2 transmembrane protein, putative [Tetrahymena thermophila SB210]